MFADSGKWFLTFANEGQIARMTALIQRAPLYVLMPYQNKPTIIRMTTTRKEQ